MNKKSDVPRAPLKNKCSRPASRRVRQKLETELLTKAAQVGQTTWPLGCRLDPAKDLWKNHDDHTIKKRGPIAPFTCGFCGKVFKTHYYLDLHMERNHMNETPPDGICLAEYCHLFDVCEKPEESETFKVQKKSATLQESAKYHYKKHKKHRKHKFLKTCNNATMDKAKKLCYDTMYKCLPFENEATRQLSGEFSRHFCSTLDCELRAEHLFDDSEPLPVLVHLLWMLAFSGIAFAIVVSIVRNSEEIIAFLSRYRLASPTTIKKITKTTERAREQLGMDVTKYV